LQIFKLSGASPGQLEARRSGEYSIATCGADYSDSDNQRAALAAAVERGPIPAAHGVVRWRLVDLVQWICDEFAVSISTQTLSRELRAMGYRKLTARPRHHAQDADAIPAFKKTSPPRWQRSGRRSPVAHP